MEIQQQYKYIRKKVKKDYGMDDYYKYYCNTSKNPVSKKVFNKVVSEFNKEIVNLIIEESLEFTPVMLNFTFCIRKYKRVPNIKGGKLYNTNNINWKATNELWENEPEAKEKKLFIKFNNNHSSKFMFRIKALKNGREFKNRKFFRFKACRSFQRTLAKRILDENKDKFEAYKLFNT